MARGVCSIEGCGKTVAARGWCGTHWMRWRTHGDPLASLYETNVGKTCGVDDCGRAAERRGWCRMHYTRFMKHGDPRVVMRIRGDDEARFYSYVLKGGPGGCWLWAGAVDKDGYGCFQLGYANVRAHRFSYEINVGPIPDGMQLDHVHARGCRHKNCVNPAHLEPVTLAENVRRRDEVQSSP